MFRNLILPALAVGLIALVVHDPAFAQDTFHKKVLAIAIIVGPVLLLRVIIGIRNPRSPRSRRGVTPYSVTARRGR